MRPSLSISWEIIFLTKTVIFEHQPLEIATRKECISIGKQMPIHNKKLISVTSIRLKMRNTKEHNIKPHLTPKLSST